MGKDNEYVVFYTGTEVAIIGLKGQLESIGVPSIVQDDFNSGVLAGFVGGSKNTVRLKIKESDIEKSKPVLENFLNA